MYKGNATDISIEDKEKFVVDKRLVNIFMKAYQPGKLADCKDTLRTIIELNTSFESLFENLEGEIYLFKIANHPALTIAPSQE